MIADDKKPAYTVAFYTYLLTVIFKCIDMALHIVIFERKIEPGTSILTLVNLNAVK